MLRPASPLDHAPSWLACCLTPPRCRLRVFELVLGGRTRCTGRDGGLERLPFLFHLCKSLQQEAVIREDRPKGLKHTQRH